MTENHYEEITSKETTLDKSRMLEINQEEVDALLKKKQSKQTSTKCQFVRFIFQTAICLLFIGGSILLYLKQSHLQTQFEADLNRSTAIQNLNLLKLQTQMERLNSEINQTEFQRRVEQFNATMADELKKQIDKISAGMNKIGTDLQNFVKQSNKITADLNQSTAIQNSDLLKLQTRMDVIIDEKKATIDHQVADISQLKNKSSELSKKVDEQKGVIDRQGGEIKKLGDNSAALLKKVNDHTKTIDELNESIKKQKREINQKDEELKKLGDNSAALLKKVNDHAKTIDELKESIKELLKVQTRMDMLNKTLNGMATVSRQLATNHSELVNPYMLFFGRHNEKMKVLNPKENKLIECKLKLPSKVREYGAAIVNNELYIFGGVIVSPYQITNKCFKLNKSHEWIEVASMKENRREITKCSVVFNSEIWVFGGYKSHGSAKTVEKYNPEENTWTYMREMIKIRAWCAASIIDEKIYVSGGSESSIEVYDPVKNEWEIFSNNMPHEGNWHSAVVDESSLLIIGGRKNGTASDEVWKINVEDPKKEWKKMPNLNQGRWHSGAAKLKNKIIVIGEKPGIEIFDGNEWTIRSSRDLGEIGSMVLLTKQSEVDLLKNVCF